MKDIQATINNIEDSSERSAWARGVKGYALELLDSVDVETWRETPLDHLEALLLNGADNWRHYSWSGCADIYDADIAARLCTPSELKRTRGGERRPNAREDWLDVQARALYQAARLIQMAAREVERLLSYGMNAETVALCAQTVWAVAMVYGIEYDEAEADILY